MGVVLSKVHFGFHDTDVESGQAVFRGVDEVNFVIKLDVEEELVLLGITQMVVGLASCVSIVFCSEK